MSVRLTAGAIGSLVLALSLPSLAEEPSALPERRSFQYAIGPKVSTAWGGIEAPARVLPSIGLAYGRWKFGSIPTDQGLQLNGLFSEPAVSYDALRTDRRNIGVSLRAQNLDRQEASDALSIKNMTLRGRLIFSYALMQDWTFAAEVTQDLLQRGDGTTASVGLVRGIDLGGRQRLFLSTSTTWANADHWNNAYRKRLPEDGDIRSTLGGLGAGATYRYWLSDSWLFWTGISVSRPIGDITRLLEPRLEYRSEIGFRWVSRARSID